MNVQQKRACTQGENQRKGQHARAPLRQPSATAPTRRQCANKARHKGSKTKSPFCVVLKTYHLDTWILHKTCLKHSNFLNRKTVCTIVSAWNIMAPAMGQGTEENKKNKLRQGSKHGNYNMLPRLIGRDLRTAFSSSNPRIPLHPLELPHSPEASNLGSRANEAIAALNRIAMSGTFVNTSCANRRKQTRKNTSRRERERNNNMDQQTLINMNSRELLETKEMQNVSKQSHWIRSRLPCPTQSNNQTQTHGMMNKMQILDSTQTVQTHLFAQQLQTTTRSGATAPTKRHCASQTPAKTTLIKTLLRLPCSSRMQSLSLQASS